MKPTARANEDREGNMDICELQMSTGFYDNDDDEEEKEKEDYGVQYEQVWTDERYSPSRDDQQNRQSHAAAVHPGSGCHPIPCDCHHEISRQGLLISNKCILSCPVFMKNKRRMRQSFI
jgi:hypothetical protein